jgi:hypothetical protein
MPLTPYLKGAVFEPQRLEAISAAFIAVCRSLQITRGPSGGNPLTEIVARKVIEIAATGESDHERLRDLALLALKAT